MVDVVATGPRAGSRPKLDVQPNMVAVLLFLALLGTGVLFTAYNLQTDIVESGMPTKTWLPFLLLGGSSRHRVGF
jgi:inorganic phosphate transporter, PiT family